MLLVHLFLLFPFTVSYCKTVVEKEKVVDVLVYRYLGLNAGTTSMLQYQFYIIDNDLINDSLLLKPDTLNVNIKKKESCDLFNEILSRIRPKHYFHQPMENAEFSGRYYDLAGKQHNYVISKGRKYFVLVDLSCKKVYRIKDIELEQQTVYWLNSIKNKRRQLLDISYP